MSAEAYGRETLLILNLEGSFSFSTLASPGRYSSGGRPLGLQDYPVGLVVHQV